MGPLLPAQSPDSGKINGSFPLQAVEEAPVSRDGSRKRRSDLPFRKRRKGSYLTVTGKFSSTKSQHPVPFEGLRERDFFVLLEFDDRVTRFVAQPMTMIARVDGRKRHYTPDVLVDLAPFPSGRPRQSQLCEVKLIREIRKKEHALRQKFAQAATYARQHGRRFRVVTERLLPQPLISNLYFLLRYRRHAANSSVRDVVLKTLQSMGAASADRLVQRLESEGHDALAAVSAIWELVAMQQASADLNKRLTMSAVLVPQPWTLRRVLADSRRKQSMNSARNHPRVDVSPLEGLDRGAGVVSIRIGEIYAVRGRSGTVRLIQLDSTDTALVADVGSGAVESVPIEDLLVIGSHERAVTRLVETMTDAQTKKALERLDAIRPFVESARRVPRSAAAAAAAKAGVATKTWLRWLRAYRKNPSLSVLVRRPRSDRRQSRLPDLIERLLQDHVEFWCLNQTRSLRDIHTSLREEIARLNASMPDAHFEAPDYTTLRLRCMQLSQFERMEGRSGHRLAKLRHGLKQGSIADVATPLSIVQIDHTELDVNVVDEDTRVFCGRPWITVAIDVFSRMVVGMYVSLAAPGNLQLGQTMVHAIMPKRQYLEDLGIEVDWPCRGIAHVVHADNAGEFQGNMLEMCAKMHGFDVCFRKVKSPNYGGFIESYLGTLSDEIKHLPGAVPKDELERGDRDPEAEAALTLRELEAILVRMIGEYHHRPHSGLQDQPPIGRWRDGCRGSAASPGLGEVRLPQNPTRLRLDFLPVVERVVGPRGILIDYIEYSDPVLQEWVGAKDPKNSRLPRKFLVRRDPRDLSVIYFWDPLREHYFPIRYRNLARPRITLWELEAIRKHIRERGISSVDEDTIFRLREERKRALDLAKTRTAQRRRVKAQEAERIALEEARRLQAAVGGSSLPRVAVHALEPQPERPLTQGAFLPADQIDSEPDPI